jgi:hypothetical protein
VGLGDGHRRALGALALLLAPPAGPAGERLTAHRLVGAAAPLGAAFGGVLLQYLLAPLVIAISGLACIFAGLGGLVSPSLRQLRGSP